jgi:uncharacterized surface protein with fasciclin (FAS1) repeats
MMIMNTTLVMIIACILACIQYPFIYETSNAISVVVHAFQGTGTTLSKVRTPVNPSEKLQNRYPRCVLYDTTTDNMSSSITTELELFLQQEHSMFYALLLYKNEYVWKMIRDTTNGACTIFAPTNTAMQALGEKKLQQLQDNRNEEVRNKIGSYHIIVDTDVDATVVTTEQLYNSGGIRTIATGDNPIVPVERNQRSSSGNIFAMFMKSGKGNDDNGDGTVILGSNNARIINSVYMRNSNTLIHQVDALISPNILWRYCDQLRIPGSK